MGRHTLPTPGRHPPPPTGRPDPPPPPSPSQETATAAVGTHPTGMHSYAVSDRGNCPFCCERIHTVVIDTLLCLHII